MQYMSCRRRLWAALKTPTTLLWTVLGLHLESEERGVEEGVAAAGSVLQSETTRVCQALGPLSIGAVDMDVVVEVGGWVVSKVGNPNLLAQNMAKIGRFHDDP